MNNEKGCSAVNKIFKKVNAKPEALRKKALGLLPECALDQVAANVKAAKDLMFEAFFTAKMHKEGEPFSTIISEKHTWQYPLSSVKKYLQTHLTSLRMRDPYVIMNSGELVRFLKESNPKGCEAFSLDIEHLYSSLPHVQLMESVKVCITEQDDKNYG